ncbi:MAG TPA: hypothetical protein VG148_10515 [Pyrinomonadaceae bacterium]|nr:hypothetical protein [Pyrinomonadaceae bacterium]
MKTLRQLCVASVLTLALTVSTLAGEIHTGITSPQHPQGITANGEIHTTVVGQEEADSSEATAADSVTDAVLNLLQSVLSLF